MDEAGDTGAVWQKVGNDNDETEIASPTSDATGEDALSTAEKGNAKEEIAKHDVDPPNQMFILELDDQLRLMGLDDHAERETKTTEELGSGTGCGSGSCNLGVLGLGFGDHDPPGVRAGASCSLTPL